MYFLDFIGLKKKKRKKENGQKKLPSPKDQSNGTIPFGLSPTNTQAPDNWPINRSH